MRLSILVALLITLATMGAAQSGGTLSFERGSWARLKAAHAGQPTVVHFWGLTCGPCLVEMPKWGELLAERRDLSLVLVAADPLPQPPEEIAATVARDHLQRAESWAFADRFYERLFYEIDPAWSGELPRTLLIAGDGTSVIMPGVADLAKVREWLDAQSKIPPTAKGN